MKTKYLKLFSILSNIIVVAGIIVGMKPTCAGSMYQPKVPKHLAEKN